MKNTIVWGILILMIGFLIACVSSIIAMQDRSLIAIDQLVAQYHEHNEHWKKNCTKIMGKSHISSKTRGKNHRFAPYKRRCSVCGKEYLSCCITRHIKTDHADAILDEKSSNIVDRLCSLPKPPLCLWPDCHKPLAYIDFKWHLVSHLTKIKSTLPDAKSDESPPLKRAHITSESLPSAKGSFTLEDLLTDPTIPLDDETIAQLT